MTLDYLTAIIAAMWTGGTLLLLRWFFMRVDAILDRVQKIEVTLARIEQRLSDGGH